MAIPWICSETCGTQSNNVRTQLFLDVCRQCYMEYTQKLDDANAVDFEEYD
jgi:hypothetical protein